MHIKIKKIFVTLPKISIVKTIYYSLKFKSKILIGRETIIHLHKNSKITVNNGIALIVLAIHNLGGITLGFRN